MSELKNSYSILVGKYERIKSFGYYKYKWAEIKEAYARMRWIELVQNEIQ